MHNDIKQVLLTEEQIKNRIKELGEELVLIRRGKARKKVLKNPPFEADTPENKE